MTVRLMLYTIRVSDTEAIHWDDLHCFNMSQTDEEDTHVDDAKEIGEGAASMKYWVPPLLQ